jgi:hypothetical protein
MKIISGGQTGADRAGLDFAIEHGIEHGGWCPKGRLAEDFLWGRNPVHPLYPGDALYEAALYEIGPMVFPQSLERPVPANPEHVAGLNPQNGAHGNLAAPEATKSHEII